MVSDQSEDYADGKAIRLSGTMNAVRKIGEIYYNKNYKLIKTWNKYFFLKSLNFAGSEISHRRSAIEDQSDNATHYQQRTICVHYRQTTAAAN